jgi:hypothetical protein
VQPITKTIEEIMAVKHHNSQWTIDHIQVVRLQLLIKLSFSFTNNNNNEKNSTIGLCLNTRLV